MTQSVAVQGCFHVAAQQPVLYTVQESMNLLSLDNMVSCCAVHDCSMPCFSQLYVQHNVMLCSVFILLIYTTGHITAVCFLQNLLRGLLPDSFPARLAAEPTTEKQRRFIIIDEEVHAIYGPQLEKVHYFQLEYNSLGIMSSCPVYSCAACLSLATEQYPSPSPAASTSRFDHFPLHVMGVSLVR